MTRKEAREQLFCLVFEQSFTTENASDIFELAREVRDFEEDEYVRSVFLGIAQKRDELDRMIGEACQGWTVERLSRVALSAMRLALYEMLYREDIPVSVSINEAVELIKQYATKDDASFANGVLGTIARAQGLQ